MDLFEGFEWDEGKRRSNIAKQTSTSSMRRMFSRDRSSWLRPRRSEASAAGWPSAGWTILCVAIVFTLRGFVVRLISMRRANNGERRHYLEVFSG
jgi:uncharacterized DUF497 family protein